MARGPSVGLAWFVLMVPLVAPIVQAHGWQSDGVIFQDGVLFDVSITRFPINPFGPEGAIAVTVSDLVTKVPIHREWFPVTDTFDEKNELVIPYAASNDDPTIDFRLDGIQVGATVYGNGTWRGAHFVVVQDPIGL